MKCNKARTRKRTGLSNPLPPLLVQVDQFIEDVQRLCVRRRLLCVDDAKTTETAAELLLCIWLEGGDYRHRS